jgi:hypothetical protein
MEVRRVNLDNRELRERGNELRRQNRKLKVQLEQKSTDEQEIRARELREFKAGILAQLDDQLDGYRRQTEMEKKALAEEYEKELVQSKESPR